MTRCVIYANKNIPIIKAKNEISFIFSDRKNLLCSFMCVLINIAQ